MELKLNLDLNNGFLNKLRGGDKQACSPRWFAPRGSGCCAARGSPRAAGVLGGAQIFIQTRPSSRCGVNVPQWAHNFRGNMTTKAFKATSKSWICKIKDQIHPVFHQLEDQI